MVGWVRNRSRQILALLGLLAILGTFTSVASRRVSSGAHDIGFLMVSTPDEFEIAKGVHRMLRERTLDYNVPAYGGFYPGLAFLFAKNTVLLKGYSEKNFALALRWFSLVAGILAIVAVFWLTLVVSGSWGASVIAALFIAACPEFMVWSVRIHPDTLLWFLLALIQGALALAVHRRSQRWLNAALVLVVFATMCKLVGLFFLPLLLLAQLYLDAVRREPHLLRRFGIHLLKGGIAFILVAYLTTPRLLVDSSRFFYNLQQTRRVTEQGLMSERPPLGWLSVLWESNVIGPIGTILFVLWIVSFVPFVIRFLRAPRARLDELSDRALLPLFPLLFGGGFLFYLTISVRNYLVRYAAPVLPTVAVVVGLTAMGYWPHLERAFRWLAGRPLWIRAVPLVLVLGALGLELRTRHLYFEYDRRKLQALDRHPQLALGDWLAKNADDGTSIIYDYNVYMPIRYKNAHVTFALLDNQARDGAKYIIIHDKRRAQFTDPNSARGGERDRELHRDRVETLAKLEAHQLYGYRKVKRFDEALLTVYANTSTEAACPEHCRTKR